MTWTFHPPPGWPRPPDGWSPPPGWAPDPAWPPAPAGWRFWLPAGSPGTGPAAPAGAPGTGPPGPGPAAPVVPDTRSPAPGRTRPAAPAAGQPWFLRWWVVAGLVGLLLASAAAGYGVTRASLNMSAAEDPPRVIAAPLTTRPPAGAGVDEPAGAGVDEPAGAGVDEPAGAGVDETGWAT